MDGFSEDLNSLTLSLTKLILTKSDLAKIYKANKKTKKKIAKSKVAPFVEAETNFTRADKTFQTVSVQWLQQHSAYSHWWLPKTSFVRPCCSAKSEKKSENCRNNALKQEPCIMWFQFTGHPVKYKSKASAFQVPVPEQRVHSVRVEQQPTGGAAVLVFAADLKIGEIFAVLSRRQPGFTLSLTFFMDGVRDSRLGGCCEAARGANAPTRIGGPAGAFLLKSIEGAVKEMLLHIKAFSPPDRNPASKELILEKINRSLYLGTL